MSHLTVGALENGKKEKERKKEMMDGRKEGKRESKKDVTEDIGKTEMEKEKAAQTHQKQNVTKLSSAHMTPATFIFTTEPDG